jgi:hypothetical protein
MPKTLARALAFLSFLLLAFVLKSGPVIAAEPMNATDGVAIDGIDTTAYFDHGEPRTGTDDHTAEWKGVAWHFETADDRDRFAADPEAYAPSYNGHCANAMSKGYVVPADLKIWKIIDNRLFVFAAERGRARWNKATDPAKFIAQADANWAKVADK